MLNIVHRLRSKILSIARQIGDRILQSLKPDTVSLVAGAAKDAIRSKAQLIAENALLRHQLIILQRQVKHPRLSNWDRLRLLLLARATPFWKQALLIIQPDTLLRWHRQLFRLAWRRKSKPKTPQTRITPETIALIRQMRTENITWGAERIRGELLKLGIKVSGRGRLSHRPTLSAPGNRTCNLALQPELGHIPAEPRRSNLVLRNSLNANDKNAPIRCQHWLGTHSGFPRERR